MTSSMPTPTAVIGPDGEQTGLHRYHNQNEDFDQYPSAAFGPRFFAAIIDSIILTLATKLMKFLFGGVIIYLKARSVLYADLLELVIQFALTFYIFAWPTSEWGCTLGKRFMGLRVVNMKSREDVGLLQAFGRETLGKGVSAVILFVGYLQVFVRKDRLALHDLMFKTRVIKYRDT